MINRHRILIVDDDRTLCSVFKEGLMAGGYYCQTAADGYSAMKLIANNAFDVMVTDVVMPGMGGLELASVVRQMKPHISVIIMTGYQHDSSHDLAREAGAADLIAKPFTISELVNRIEKALRNNSSVDAIQDHAVLTDMRSNLFAKK